MNLRALSLLALAGALALTNSSCLRAQRAHRNHALAVKAEAEADLAHAQADALRDGQAPEEIVAGEHPPVPPQALIESVPPAPTSIHVWIAGAHEWDAGTWHWVAGHWALPPRVGAAWLPGHFTRHERGHLWVDGRWR